MSVEYFLVFRSTGTSLDSFLDPVVSSARGSRPGTNPALRAVRSASGTRREDQIQIRRQRSVT